jgi:hypothetical protein
MTPQVKAASLFGIMLNSLPLTEIGVQYEIDLAKKLATILVDEILQSRPGFPYPQDIGINVRGIFNIVNYPEQYWNEVKVEIQKIK